MAAPKRKTAAKKPPEADVSDVNWEDEARRLSLANQQLTQQNRALRGQLVGFVQMLEGVVTSIRGESQPPPSAQ